MSKRNILIVGRLFFGVLTLVAVGIQFFGVHLPHGFDAVNFFSYFTNLSNIFASVVFIVGAIYLLQGREATATDALSHHFRSVLPRCVRPTPLPGGPQ